MKTQVLVIALALATGAGWATAQTAKGNASDSTAATTTTQTTTTKVTKKSASKKHARQMAKRHAKMGASAAPQTDLNDRNRQARMDEALEKYRRGSS